MGLRRLNWGQVTDGRPPWASTSGPLFAIWPSPVDHDVCFEAAGVDELGDTDAEWNNAFEGIIDQLINKLSQLGPPALTQGEYPRTGRRPSNSLRDALLASSLDDNFPPCGVSFGVPARASLRTSDGHAIVWVWIESGGPPFDLMVSEIAGIVPIREATLKWSELW